MLDLSALRKLVPVITVEEFLLLHGRNASLEVGNGGWAYELYQGPNYDAYRIPNEPGHLDELFEPPSTVRVDRLPEMPSSIVPQPATRERDVHDRLMERLSEHGVITPSLASELLMGMNVEPLPGSVWNDEMLEATMRKHGFGKLHTYLSRYDSRATPRTQFLFETHVHLLTCRDDNIQKSVVTPTEEYAPYLWMRGLIDDYGHRTENVVHLPQEIHDRKKPVSSTCHDRLGEGLNLNTTSLSSKRDP